MPRTTRLIINDETAVYHVMSRTALDGFPLGDIEKDFMLNLIRRYSQLYLVEIIGFCLTKLNSLSKNVLHVCPAE
jgi:putative transposase